MTLTELHLRILRFASTNGGLIHTGVWHSGEAQQAVKQLVRSGLLAVGSGVHGRDARRLTEHGRQALAAHDNQPKEQ